MDENVNSLADPKRDNLRIIGLNLNKVVRYDRHIVFVDGNALRSLRTRVDEAHAMGLSWCKRELGKAGIVRTLCSITGSYSRTVEVHLPIDQVVVRKGLAGKPGAHNLLHYRIIILVPPVYASVSQWFL